MKKINRRLFLLAAPLIIGFLMFYLIPMIRSVRYSFLKSAFDPTFVGLRNYIEALCNSYFRLSVKNTLEMILFGVPGLVISSIVLAVSIQALDKKISLLLQAVLVIPMLIPSVAVAKVFGKMMVDNPRIPLLAMYLWKNMGFLVLIYLSAFSAIPTEVYEASALDGAGRMRVFFCITLPMISGQVMFSVILAITYNLRLFREAYLMYGAYPDRSVYLVQHYMNNHFSKLNYQKLTSASTLFAFALFSVLGIGMKIINWMSGEKKR